jgi:hypothetical protein
MGPMTVLATLERGRLVAYQLYYGDASCHLAVARPGWVPLPRIMQS